MLLIILEKERRSILGGPFAPKCVVISTSFWHVAASHDFGCHSFAAVMRLLSMMPHVHKVTGSTLPCCRLLWVQRPALSFLIAIGSMALWYYGIYTILL